MAWLALSSGKFPGRLCLLSRKNCALLRAHLPMAISSDGRPSCRSGTGCLSPTRPILLYVYSLSRNSALCSFDHKRVPQGFLSRLAQLRAPNQLWFDWRPNQRRIARTDQSGCYCESAAHRSIAFSVVLTYAFSWSRLNPLMPTASFWWSLHGPWLSSCAYLRR